MPLYPLRRRAWWFALVAWCALIFVLSAQPQLGSDLGPLDTLLRKLAHVLEYAVLAFVTSMTLRQEGLPPRRTMWLALAFCVLYGAGDEWHQTSVQGRHGTPVDVLIDTVGASIVAVAVAWRRQSRRIVGA